MTAAARPFALVSAVAGWILWSAALVALYAVLSVGCELGWQDRMLGIVSLQRLVLLALWLGSVGVLAWLATASWIRLHHESSGRSGLAGLTLGLAAYGYLAALGATFWMGLPILAASTCI
jgi:fermentation-respiration switch protein FrsA (DUF1100 family)